MKGQGVALNASTAETRSSARRVQTGIVALLVAFSVMSYFDRTIMSIASPDIIKEFGLSETQMGIIHSSFLVSYTMLMIGGGHLADRLGPRLVLTLMGLGAALFTGLTALGGKPGLGAYLGIVPSFVLIRVTLGVSTSPLYPSCARMNANWVHLLNRARIWGYVAAGAGLGAAVSPLLFSWSIAQYGWRLSFWMAGAVTAALAVLWWSYARDYPSEHPAVGLQGSRMLLGDADGAPQHRAAATPWRELLTDKNLVLLTLAYFTTNYYSYIFFYWIYYYFGQIRRMGPRQTAVYTTAIFLAWTVMTPLGGWVSDRLVKRFGRKIGRRIVPIGGLTLGAILLYRGTSLASPIATAAVLSLSLGFVGGTDGAYWASAIDLGGSEVGAASGIMNCGGNFGGIFAPVMTPIIASIAGWSWGLYFGCIVLMLSVLAWFFIDPTRSITASHPAGVIPRSEPSPGAIS